MAIIFNKNLQSTKSHILNTFKVVHIFQCLAQYVPKNCLFDSKCFDTFRKQVQLIPLVVGICPFFCCAQAQQNVMREFKLVGTESVCVVSHHVSCNKKRPILMYCSVWRLAHQPLNPEAEQAWCSCCYTSDHNCVQKHCLGNITSAIGWDEFMSD